MTWREITLGSAIHVKHGYAFKGEFFADHGEYIVLTPGNFNEEGGFRSRPEKDRAYAGDIPESYVLDESDLIVAMTEQGAGLLGSAALVPQANRYLHNQRLGLVDHVDASVLDKRFLYLLFNTRSVRAQISGSASGTKVRHTAPERIYRVRVRVPDVSTQASIAEIVLAYDDLIENNHRRMALLEESARLLYREWFVRLRFPGHEHTRITDGVPGGWEKKCLGELVKIRKGRNITQATAESGMVPVVAGGLSPAYFHNSANAKGPVVTISASGANAGYVNLYLGDIWASDCSFISTEWTQDVFYFYCLLNDRQRDLFAFQKGAAQPHVYPKDIQTLVVMGPPSGLLRAFNDTARSAFALTENLAGQNQKLRAARDLLLPRLMSGEIAA